ncbi:radical SAM protein [Vallitalea sp.]|uniref:radical SAM protein n=1 Tax=Vallitalea sp. TaxID=1882829 RepID=UPI0025D08E31|nr:radical SAM protein [Vallitalea sp.]MCT4688870.1 radical SAM protein [Vallitalea sp.]
MKKQRLDLHLYTNEYCNIHCKHCYNDSGDARFKKEIPLENINSIIQELYEAYDLDIHIEGGEIFLRPKIFNTLAILDKEILQCMTITSNGTIFMDTPDVQYVLKHIENFRISVEGHTNELNSVLRDCDVLKVLNNAEKYQKMGANIVLRITLHRGNIQTLIRDTLPALANRGFHNFQIYELQSVGRGDGLDYCIREEKDFNDFIDTLIEYLPTRMNVKLMFNKSRVKSINLRKNELIKAEIQVEEIEPNLSLSIKSDGGVNICPWDTFGDVLFNIHHENNLVKRLNQFNLLHDCEHCSKIKMKVGKTC